MAAPRKLTEIMKSEVVCALAAFQTPTSIAEWLLSEHGVTVSRQAIAAFDPTTRAGRRLALRWRELFTEARQRFLKNVAEIGIANRAVRLRRLEDACTAAQERGDHAFVLQCLEMGAKEIEGWYAGRRQVTAQLTELPPEPTIPTITEDMSDAEAAEVWAQELRRPRPPLRPLPRPLTAREERAAAAAFEAVVRRPYELKN